MVCHELKCIFVHVPKTAGQSIERYFLARVGLDWDTRDRLLLRPNDDPEKGPPRLAHLTAEEYVTCGHVTPEQFAEYYKFTFVRNPWDRLVSEYRYQRYAMRHTFADWVLHHFPQPGFCDRYRHVMPQTSFLCNASVGTMVDYVGRFERLDESFGEVCRALSLPIKPLPTTNVSTSKASPKGFAHRVLGRTLATIPAPVSYKHYFTDETLDFVDWYYRDDIEQLRYSFDS